MQVSPWAGKIPLEGRVATHSSILAWRIPWTEESGGLYIVHRVSKNWTQLQQLSTRAQETPAI